MSCYGGPDLERASSEVRWCSTAQTRVRVATVFQVCGADSAVAAKPAAKEMDHMRVKHNRVEWVILTTVPQ